MTDGTDPADLDAAARRLREELWVLHAGVESHRRSTNEIDEAELVPLIALTADVLDLERRADVQRRDRRLSRSAVTAACGVWAAVSAAVLAVGPLSGWLTGWGTVSTTAGLLLAIALGVLHRISPPAGHRRRRVLAVAAAGAGVAMAALSAGGLPWWSSSVLLVVVVVSGAFASTVSRSGHPR